MAILRLEGSELLTFYLMILLVDLQMLYTQNQIVLH